MDKFHKGWAAEVIIIFAVCDSEETSEHDMRSVEFRMNNNIALCHWTGGEAKEHLIFCLNIRFD